jgi:hypothetical protein
VVEVAGGFVAWLGASLVVLSDGRRGLALGVGLGGAGLAVLAWHDAGLLAAAAIAVGGLVAALGRVRAGGPGWQIMPPGSTPRTVLCVGAGLLALWFALAITSGPSAGLRFATVACLVLPAARVLWSDGPEVALAAVAVLALAAGTASAVGSSASDPWAFVAAAVVAAAVGWMPARQPRAA